MPKLNDVPILTTESSDMYLLIEKQGDFGRTPLSSIKGVSGSNGQGVPSGGTAGQVLAKIDTTSFNTEWIDPPSSNIGFSAHKNGNNVTNIQTGVPQADTKITFATEVYDNGSYYDASTSRFTPLVAGYYLVVGSMQLDTGGTGSTRQELNLFKNGAREKRLAITQRPSSALAISSQGSAIVYLNGTTDYIELYAWHETGSDRTIYAYPYSTFFQVQKVG